MGSNQVAAIQVPQSRKRIAVVICHIPLEARGASSHMDCNLNEAASLHVISWKRKAAMCAQHITLISSLPLGWPARALSGF